MESLIILIPIAVILIAVAVKIFLWAIDNDQFDDLEGPAHTILFEDDKTIKSSSNKPSTSASLSTPSSTEQP